MVWAIRFISARSMLGSFCIETGLADLVIDKLTKLSDRSVKYRHSTMEAGRSVRSDTRSQILAIARRCLQLCQQHQQT
jgi:hypothetical protein